MCQPFYRGSVHLQVIIILFGPGVRTKKIGIEIEHGIIHIGCLKDNVQQGNMRCFTSNIAGESRGGELFTAYSRERLSSTVYETKQRPTPTLTPSQTQPLYRWLLVETAPFFSYHTQHVPINLSNRCTGQTDYDLSIYLSTDDRSSSSLSCRRESFYCAGSAYSNTDSNPGNTCH